MDALLANAGFKKIKGNDCCYWELATDSSSVRGILTLLEITYLEGKVVISCSEYYSNCLISLSNVTYPISTERFVSILKEM